MESFVEQECEMRLVAAPGGSVAVPTRLSYSPYDPYAVEVTFRFGQACPVTWVFSRELLAEGLHGPCGQGDVRIWPVLGDARCEALCLVLSAPDGSAVLEVPTAVVERWLKRTYRVVPAGREAELLDLDVELCGLLGEAA
ncbi:SsgA family sporulation/cell division regulator [Streptomyces spiralis]